MKLPDWIINLLARHYSLVKPFTLVLIISLTVAIITGVNYGLAYATAAFIASFIVCIPSIYIIGIFIGGLRSVFK